MGNIISENNNGMVVNNNGNDDLNNYKSCCQCLLCSSCILGALAIYHKLIQT